MKEFYYSFAFTMLHSIWQMAVLLLLSLFCFGLFKNLHPTFKRNVLYTVVLLQVCTSFFTFFYYHNKPDFYESILTGLISKNIIGSESQQFVGYLFYAYSFIVVFKIGSLIINCISFKNKYSSDLLRPCSDTRMFTTLKAYEFGIKRKVQVWYSYRVDTPLTFGFLKPIILLPIALMSNLNVQESESLIIHELTHIKNNDYLLNWLLLITEAIYFFNPVFKIVVKKIKLEREKSCDTQVIQFKYSPILYAEALLKLENLKRHNLLQLAASGTKEQLLKRIHFFSNEKNQQFSNKNFQLPVVVFLLFIFIINIFLLGIFKNNTDKLISTKQETKYFTKTSEVNRRIKTTVSSTTASDTTTTVSTNEIKNTKQSSRVAKKIQEFEVPYKNELLENFNAVPVALKTPAVALSKQVEVSEETSSGKIVTQVYQVQLIKGKWITKPLYMTTEIKSPKDSLKLKSDSSIYQIIDNVQ
jgi:beta-lactamase regulating signal transducer with metallopeptidase domain